MDIQRKFWFVLIGAIAGLGIIACSCSSLIPTPTPTSAPVVTEPPVATEAPIATQAPIATSVPVATSPATGREAIPGLAGRWNDPQTKGTITTIIWANGGYVVPSVINPSRGGNEVTKYTWSNNVLTWTYCVPNGNCLTSMVASVNGDSLDTFWTDDQGNSGQDTFNRLP